MMTGHKERDPHEALQELCALSTSGVLSAEEKAELDAHLESCSGCRQLYSQYQALAREGMPFLASSVANGTFADESFADDSFQEERGAPLWNNARARRRLLSAVDSIPEPEPVPGRRLPWPFANRWSKVAAAACVLIAVGAGFYLLGKRNEASAQSAYVAILKRLQEVSVEKMSLDQAVALHIGRESQDQAESSQREHEIEQLQTQLRDLDRKSNALAVDTAGKEDRLKDLAQQRNALAERLQKVEQAFQDSQSQIAQLRTISQDRDALTSRLHTTEERYQTAQTELAKLTDQLNREGDPALKEQVHELSARIEDQQQQLKRNDQYLASDRDIRELMGARQLYIADVFDVSGDGRTRKPFGRVFYTRGASLIFYAFDLDHQPGLKNASTFQVWGQKEAARGESARALNLGILYMDSASNRRWVLRSDDPKQLAEIDAVFVTVEPGGGSRKPTGKPFLYALLRKEANHP